MANKRMRKDCSAQHRVVSRALCSPEAARSVVHAPTRRASTWSLSHRRVCLERRQSFGRLASSSSNRSKTLTNMRARALVLPVERTDALLMVTMTAAAAAAFESSICVDFRARARAHAATHANSYVSTLTGRLRQTRSESECVSSFWRTCARERGLAGWTCATCDHAAAAAACFAAVREI